MPELLVHRKLGIKGQTLSKPPRNFLLLTYPNPKDSFSFLRTEIPAFLAPGTGFVDDNFSTDQVAGAG